MNISHKHIHKICGIWVVFANMKWINVSGYIFVVSESICWCLINCKRWDVIKLFDLVLRAHGFKGTSITRFILEALRKNGSRYPSSETYSGFGQYLAKVFINTLWSSASGFFLSYVTILRATFKEITEFTNRKYLTCYVWQYIKLHSAICLSNSTTFNVPFLYSILFVALRLFFSFRFFKIFYAFILIPPVILLFFVL